MYLSWLQVLRANSINTEMAIKQGQVPHVLLVHYPISFWISAVFCGCDLSQAKFRFTDQCLPCLPESLTHDNHPIFMRCYPAVERLCVFQYLCLFHKF